MYKMKKEENIPYKFESLSDLHRVLGLPKPLHPLISLVENKDNEKSNTEQSGGKSVLPIPEQIP